MISVDTSSDNFLLNDRSARCVLDKCGMTLCRKEAAVSAATAAGGKEETILSISEHHDYRSMRDATSGTSGIMRNSVQENRKLLERESVLRVFFFSKKSRERVESCRGQ